MPRRPSTRIRRVLAAAIVIPAVLLTARGTQAAGSVTVTPPGTQNFIIYNPPDGTKGQHTADEPSIGADWVHNAVMYQSLEVTLKVLFDDSQSPPTATWTDVTGPITTTQATLDPILFTDPATGRTFVNQLSLQGACSWAEWSDNDGGSWNLSSGCALPSGIDHESVGGGPFAIVPGPPAPAYPHAVYYCSQAAADAYCGLSLDGGTTYNQGVPIYTAAQCGGLHGHIRVAPDGTAIVPNQNCTGTPMPANALGLFPNQGAVVSKTDGQSWNVNVIPDSSSTLRSDPSTAADSAGKWYFGYESGVFDTSGTQVSGKAMISTSTDDGTNWAPSVDVGAPLGIQNVTFPEVIAGGPGRAAYAFLGSTTSGDPESQTFQGLWDLYIAFTYDGGQTWSVSNLTPGDPVERGCIFLAGTGDCPNPAKRNLYDFMDITADSHGRVLVGYSDGCSGTCDSQQSQPCSDAACDTGPTASTDHLASIARETCGEGLLSQFDSALACANVAATPDAPWVPALLVTGAGGIVAVGWSRRRQRTSGAVAT